MFPGQFMVMDPMGGQVQLPGQHMLEPTFGLPATWIDAALRDQAQLKGYTVVDAATVSKAIDVYRKKAPTGSGSLQDIDTKKGN